MNAMQRMEQAVKRGAAAASVGTAVCAPFLGSSATTCGTVAFVAIGGLSFFGDTLIPPASLTVTNASAHALEFELHNDNFFGHFLFVPRTSRVTVGAGSSHTFQAAGACVLVARLRGKKYAVMTIANGIGSTTVM